MPTALLMLNDPAALDASAAGGKGAGLAQLAAAGFPVPPAIILPPETAQRAADDADLLERILARALEVAGADALLAVRSSATDEDSAESSFAGQHETVLNVPPSADPLRDAIAQCLASAATEAAREYRRTRRLDGKASMAVVVQRMLVPEAAGVVFTIDPVAGDESRVIIEAVSGLGDALVSGQALGERTVVDRRTGTILVAPDSPSPVLSAEQAAELSRMALRVEAAVGGPQDIEFAYEGGTLWLLQSRPITTTSRGEFDTPTTPDDYWTAANIQEVLPGLLTPLSISVFEANADTGYGEGYERLRLLRRGERPKFVGMFHNRAFLNIGATRLIAERAFGSSGDAVEHRFLGGELRMEPDRLHTLELWKFRLTSIPFLAWMTLGIERRGNRTEARAIELERKVQSFDVKTFSDARLDRVRLAAARFGAQTFQVHLWASAVAALGFDVISRLVRPVLGADTEARLPLLFSGLQGLESADIGVDMYTLALAARRAGIADRLHEPAFVPTSADLPAAWREAYAAFMARHGHRGINEMEFSAVPWRREPSPVLSVVASYLDLPTATSPPEALARQKAARLALTDEVVRGLRWWQRPAFKFQLGYAQRWVALRERTKSAVVRATRLADYLLPEIERRLIERQLLHEPGDIFFLTTAEVSSALRDEERLGSLDARVARRRREFESNSHLILPERFRGYPTPVTLDHADHHGEVLTGTPVSPGVVTGRARVIRDPEADGPLLRGEVLVAPVTDAGWTPLFALAAGLVVDMGSALSHGSTIAREYGLPAVVNVRTGTRAIHNGDLVRVDGYAGTVTVLEEPAAEEC